MLTRVSTVPVVDLTLQGLAVRDQGMIAGAKFVDQFRESFPEPGFIDTGPDDRRLADQIIQGFGYL